MAGKYLVTGGSGFLGAALVRRLVRDGHDVRVLDNHWRGSLEGLQDVIDGIEVVTADIRNAEAVRHACAGVNCVCHLAFINGTEHFYNRPELVLDVGIKGMINVIDACLAHNVGDLVVASSSEVYQTPPAVPTDETAPLSVPDPLNPRYSYGGGKIASELLALNWGRKHFKRVVIFRPHNVYGPAMGWEHVIPQFLSRIHQLRDEGPLVQFPIQGTGRETRAFLYIDDFIDALQRVIASGEHMNIYHIGSMQEITIADVIHAIGALYRKQIEIVPGELAPGSTLRRCPDTAKLKRLGFSPKISFPEGLRRTARWYEQALQRASEASRAA